MNVPAVTEQDERHDTPSAALLLPIESNLVAAVPSRNLFNTVPTRPNATSAITLRNALNRASMFAAANAGLENRDGQPLPMAAWMGR